MTSIEWLVKELFLEDTIYRYNLKVIEQAKEMEREQHGKTWDAGLSKYEVRAGNYMRAYEDFDDWYAETYGSKGSDDTPMERKLLKSGFVDVVPQQEISDEEIEEASLNIEHYNLDMIVIERIMWRKGAKWYREQLKQRQ